MERRRRHFVALAALAVPWLAPQLGCSSLPVSPPSETPAPPPAPAAARPGGSAGAGSAPPPIQQAGHVQAAPPAPPAKAPPDGSAAAPNRPLVQPPLSPADGLQVPDLKPLPINLPTALKLTNARAWDISIAAESLRAASAALLASKVLWIPTVVAGVDYQHHDGPLQSNDGSVANSGRSSFAVGFAPEIVFATTDAIFEPLVARQVESARRQQLQATTNDTTLSVAQAYFDVQEARGDLAGVRDTLRRTNLMLERIEKLAPDLVPRVEVSRARAQLAHLEQNEESARERWNVASAALVRILRMNPTTVVEPAEPPHLTVTLIPPDEPVEHLLSLALATRPELAAARNLAQAAEARWREERFRPLLPNVYARGGEGQLPDTLAVSGFGGSTGGKVGSLGLRDDFEVQVMWELRNFGFGNAALIRGRRAEADSNRIQAFRAQDVVAQEVVQAVARVRSAAARITRAERELKEAVQSAEDNYTGLGETKRVGGNIVILVIRPQEAIASVQALSQAYADYYGAVADYNRAEFGLYRALGNPAQALASLPPSE
jgi:outer membrane protein TolC